MRPYARIRSVVARHRRRRPHGRMQCASTPGYGWWSRNAVAATAGCCARCAGGPAQGHGAALSCSPTPRQPWFIVDSGWGAEWKRRGALHAPAGDDVGPSPVVRRARSGVPLASWSTVPGRCRGRGEPDAPLRPESLYCRFRSPLPGASHEAGRYLRHPGCGTSLHTQGWSGLAATPASP